MPRQLVRLSAVRTPQVTDDSYSSAQIQNAEADSLTTQDYIQYILSQIRLIQGTQSWKQPPVTSLVTVAATVEQVQQDMAQVASLAAQVTALTQQIQGDEADAVTQAQIAILNAQIATTASQMQAQSQAAAAQMQAVSQNLAALQITQAQQATAIAAMVTPTGLQNAIATAQLFDQRLTGVQNKVNRIFQTPSHFVQGSLRVCLNGQRLYPGALNDYVAGESSVGLGFNQITLTAAQAAPGSHDLLTADYLRA
jgi:hypothetical protein